MPEDTEVRYKRAMASIFLSGDDYPFVVTQTPGEVADLVRNGVENKEILIELTLGNQSSWNNRPLFVDPREVKAISPPKDLEEDDD